MRGYLTAPPAVSRRREVLREKRDAARRGGGCSTRGMEESVANELKGPQSKGALLLQYSQERSAGCLMGGAANRERSRATTFAPKVWRECRRPQGLTTTSTPGRACQGLERVHR